MTTTQDLCLGDRAVECDCDPALHRPVLLDPWLTGLGIRACLRCGTVTVTECRGDEGRYTGNSSQAYFKIAVPEEALAWMAQWPRAKFTWHNGRWPMSAGLVPRDIVYFSADIRCESAAELEQLEVRLAADTRTLGRVLRELPSPSTPPPAGIPPLLQGFAAVWQALRLRPDGDVHLLMRLAQLGSAASAVAVDVLLERRDADSLMLEALLSNDPVWLSAGIALARERKLVHPRLVSLLIELLGNGASGSGNRSAADSSRLESLLVLVADLKLDAPEMLEALRDLRRSVARHHPDLVRSISIVLAEFAGEPPPEHRTSFLP
jgi:hypothetical protein